jgi:uncharacterized protein YjiS (DUF1127 family)
MTTHSLPITVIVSRRPARRVADALREAWLAWRRRRREHAALEVLAGLDDHTLRDIGASGELRAHAEARQSAAYHRMAGLLG